jgi:predicted Zn-dependent peptidase
MALDVLDSLHQHGLNAQILESSKNYIKGGFPPDYETNNALSNLLTDMFFYGFDEGFINNFQKNVDGLTVEKSKEIIGKYFPKDKLQFVLVGKADEIREKVKKYGTLVEKDIKEDEF